MRIAVNTRFLLKDYLEGYGYFIYETMRRITANHPEHEFIFIFDRPHEYGSRFGNNVKTVVMGPPARHPLLWKLWYDLRIPVILKKYKADIFVSCDGFASLTTTVPQCVVIHDLSFLHYPAFIPKSHLIFYKRYTPGFLKKAASIATVSYFSKKDILSNYNIEADKINVVYNAAKESFRPLNEIQKQEVREKYTKGKHYFIYTGAIHPRKNLVNLLKAFSVFKKRQKTDWKLVIAGRLAWQYEKFVENLKTYKYREDVVMTGYLPEQELSGLTGAAYGLIYPSLWEGFGVPVLEAMQSGIPVVTSHNSSMQEIADDAALYADPSDYHDIADKMMMLYKDESLRTMLIEKGKIVATRYSWDKTADLLWESIITAANTGLR